MSNLPNSRQMQRIESGARKPRRSKPSRHNKSMIIPVLCVLIGALFLAYPVIATRWNDRAQVEIAEAYQEEIRRIAPNAKQQMIDEARRYNEMIPGRVVLDPLLAKEGIHTPEYAHYRGVLATPLNSMGVLIIPKIHVRLSIYHGTSDEVLAKGLGHMYGSDLPVGGHNRHAVITGHTGLTNATMFDHLVDLRQGDVFFIETQGEKLGYRVVQTNVVDPDDPSLLERIPGKDLVTLLTCTPYGINSERLLVRAERVIPTPFEETITNWSLSWWMILMGSGVILALTVVARMIWILLWRRDSAQPARAHTTLKKETTGLIQNQQMVR